MYLTLIHHSQFGDIYQEEHFIKYLSPDIRIVKELPKELQSLDLEAIGSVVSLHFGSFMRTISSSFSFCFVHV